MIWGYPYKIHTSFNFAEFFKICLSNLRMAGTTGTVELDVFTCSSDPPKPWLFVVYRG